MRSSPNLVPAKEFLDELRDPAQAFYTVVEEVRLPLPWSRGRVTLIGDAAHASTPFMGQGGAMAMEDSIVLADMLAQGGNVAQTLLDIRPRRQPKCAFVQEPLAARRWQVSRASTSACAQCPHARTRAGGCRQLLPETVCV